MAISKKQQIRSIRILLTVFYGFLLSNTIFRYIIHGIVETIRRPSNPFTITEIIVRTLILVSIVLAINAIWFDKTIIILASGIVLIFLFIITLIFGIIRVIKTAPHLVLSPPSVSDVVINTDESFDVGKVTMANKLASTSDTYALVEDVSELAVELLFILFAVLATFILYRYVKSKYLGIPTSEEESQKKTST